MGTKSVDWKPQEKPKWMPCSCFSCATQTKVLSSLTPQWQRMKHGCFTTHLRANNSQSIGTTLILPKKKKLKINLNQEKYGNCLLRLKGGSYAWFYASWDHHKCCSILWNDKKVQTCNFEQKTRDAERQHLLTAWQHEGAHCNSYPAVVAEFQLGSFGPSSSDPKPCCQRFPFVFAFKVTSDQPEVLRNEEVKSKVITRLNVQAAEFYGIRIQNLVPSLNKCLDKVVIMLNNS